MKKLWITLCLLLGMAGAAVLGVSLYRLNAERQRAIALQRAEDAVDSSLRASWGKPFVNQAAEEGFAQRETAEVGDDLAVYTSPEGIRFCSRSEAWDEAKLEALYQELLRNRHGPELNTLAQVLVRPESDDFAAASHQRMGQSYSLTLKFPSLPEARIFTIYRIGGVITLYDGDSLTTAEAMASSLSHEYGHHYTLHYMFERSMGNPVYEGSEYARLRGLDPEQVRANAYSADDYHENHAWYFYEIAAEDYVVLMGSPNSRSVADYYDIREALNGRDGSVPFCRNAQVQENLMIPMANEVPGLAEYFYSFLEEPAPVYSPRKIDLELEEYTVGYDLVGGYRSFTSYEVTWNKAYGEDAVYTLVCFDETDYENSYQPIKTVTAGEEASAEIGNLAVRSGNTVTNIDDHLAQGTRTFAVTVILPDGTMYCSEPLQYTF